MTDLRDAVMGVLWPILGGNHTDVETWNEISDALEADRAATRADERAKVVGEIVARLKEENGLCDCFAHDPRECACGAWDDYKSMSLERVWGLIEQEFSHE